MAGCTVVPYVYLRTGLSLSSLLTGTNCEGFPIACLPCVIANATVWDSVYLVPASAAPLTRLCLGEDNLLLIYHDGRARLWDTRTREFWRSMSLEKAAELVQQGGWLEWLVSLVSFYRSIPLTFDQDNRRPC